MDFFFWFATALQNQLPTFWWVNYQLLCIHNSLFFLFYSDGIREKDKNSLGTTLQQIAVFNPRDNSYSLNKHLYADVRPEWPLYSDDDRHLLKK